MVALEVYNVMSHQGVSCWVPALSQVSGVTKGVKRGAWEFFLTLLYNAIWCGSPPASACLFYVFNLSPESQCGLSSELLVVSHTALPLIFSAFFQLIKQFGTLLNYCGKVILPVHAIAHYSQIICGVVVMVFFLI